MVHICFHALTSQIYYKDSMDIFSIALILIPMSSKILLRSCEPEVPSSGEICFSMLLEKSNVVRKVPWHTHTHHKTCFPACDMYIYSAPARACVYSACMHAWCISVTIRQPIPNGQKDAGAEGRQQQLSSCVC